MGKRPSLYALKAFETAARYQSLTLAANELSVTQSAVSKHVQALESYFGCKLFKRKGPKVFLTKRGQVFSVELENAFNSLDTACHNLSMNDEVCVYLKSPMTFFTHWLIPVLNKIKKNENILMVKLHCSKADNELISFKSEEYDCAIQYGNGDFAENLEITKLMDECLIPVCSPEVKQTSKKINDGSVNLLHTTLNKNNWELWQRKSGHQFSMQFQNEQFFDTMQTAINFAEAGLGIVIADLNMIVYELSSGVLEPVFNDAVYSGYGYYLVWPRNHPKEKELIQLKAHILSEINISSLAGINYIK